MFNKLVRLVRGSLPELVMLLKLINEVVELVNKAVNYDRSLPELRFLLSRAEREPVFSPSEEGRTVGLDLKALVESKVKFEPVFSHYGAGGHVAALHAHRQNKYFAKLDIKNFFYSISRNQVGHALYDIGISDPGYFARWSTVKNPYKSPNYALPYGFVQSPVLATLVLRKSKLGRLVQEMSKTLTASVYLDDISISANEEAVVDSALNALVTVTADSGFVVNMAKLSGPASRLEIFNCLLEHGVSEVTENRRAEFYSVERSPESVAGFERYCAAVEATTSVAATV